MGDLRDQISAGLNLSLAAVPDWTHDQYLFDPSLLVAPVTEFEARQREVYLPAGSEWFDAQTGRRIPGGRTIVAGAPRERVPLFVRTGAIIPGGPDVQWSDENPRGALTIDLFTGVTEVEIPSQPGAKRRLAVPEKECGWSSSLIAAHPEDASKRRCSFGRWRRKRR
ncbi:hypothetical protein LY632_10135 [Erythrobacter sp. SDW2]|uniref:TIM-barrel domain-containing protein n=1 Tax=Erythrobacter sp. SDW2 TaxID=2907154 RepID=UPI001F3964EB|nr:TIM-barrel domain-containing protein [Erythrobacter sp. SDW2]UIP06057.1 hypothetical protein LY632_10135 [Erythrobacter sp. SDW2]